MAEWSNASDSKSDLRAIVTGVRIPLSPPYEDASKGCVILWRKYGGFEPKGSATRRGGTKTSIKNYSNTVFFVLSDLSANFRFLKQHLSKRKLSARALAQADQYAILQLQLAGRFLTFSQWRIKCGMSIFFRLIMAISMLVPRTI